jgi:8-oxo-dGTP diphosphatase
MSDSTRNMPKAQSIEILSRGALIDQGWVLLCRDKRGGYSYLPGGHVEIGETAIQAVIRELREEAGVSIQTGPLLLAAENLFIQKGVPRQEITLVFHVEHQLSREEPVPSLENHIEFWWAELASVCDIDLRPHSAKAWLMTLGSDDQHPTAAWASES